MPEVKDQKMLYLKSGKQTHRDPEHPTAEWGSFVRFIEIGADGYASRQIDVFVNCCALMYDRELWMDEDSMLADMKYDEEKWAQAWGPCQEITRESFEVEWEFAEAAPNQPQKYVADEEWPLLGKTLGEDEDSEE